MIYANNENRYYADLFINVAIVIVIGTFFIIVGKYLMDIGKDQFPDWSTIGQIFEAGGILLIIFVLVLILGPIIIKFILDLLLSRNNPEAVTY